MLYLLVLFCPLFQEIELFFMKNINSHSKEGSSLNSSRLVGNGLDRGNPFDLSVICWHRRLHEKSTEGLLSFLNYGQQTRPVFGRQAIFSTFTQNKRREEKRVNPFEPRAVSLWVLL